MNLVQRVLGVTCFLREGIVVLLDPMLQLALLIQGSQDAVAVCGTGLLPILQDGLASSGLISTLGFRSIVINSSSCADTGTSVGDTVFGSSDEISQHFGFFCQSFRFFSILVSAHICEG